MPSLRLYVVHGSHPCAAVEKALALKGLPYSVWEWPPPMHAPMQRVLFGARTVPALRVDGAEKISGSTTIMRRLDQMVPEPLLFPLDPERRRAVEAAEAFNEDVCQQVGRNLIWVGIQHRPAAMISYSRGSRIRLPAPAIRGSAPVIARAARALNRTNDTVARRDLTALPGYLDRVDGYMADGTIGDPEHPNAADLQLGATVRLLLTMADVRPLIDGRPSAELARRLYPAWAGELPAGALPAL